MTNPSSHLARLVEKVVASTPVDDIHTHLYDPAFGPLLLWGIDDLLVYHYLVSEAFRNFSLPYEAFWSMSKEEQASLIWKELFLNRSPVSEACRGVLTTLNRLGLDPRKNDLPKLRKWFKKWDVQEYTTRCMELANVRSICMTNSPFDDLERPIWEQGFQRDQRFKAALRIDPLLVSWPQTAAQLQKWGFKVRQDLGGQTYAEVRRFLDHWALQIDAQFLMVSLPPDFRFPDQTHCAKLIEHAVLPSCTESGLPFALMLGVERGVNPQLRLAGDGMGRSDLGALKHLCAAFPATKFLCTVLSRENQHELCVLARKFRNLHIFGCWWFTNIPSVIEEMTRERLELLGLSFTPQHSDARVLDQIIYKWEHSRNLITKVLVEKYADLIPSGWKPSTKEIQRDVNLLLGGAYADFRNRSLQGS